MSSSRPNKGRPRPRPKPPPVPEVRAAGGLVWRAAVVADETGETRPSLEVVLVHRPRYDDWSFPKGKLDRGESFESAAVREVAEETGLVCELGGELPSTTYLDGKRRLKLVRYWAMRPVEVGPWSPNDEIDGRRWVPLDDAADLLTYAHDRALLDAFTASRDGAM
ncbi:MAG TPA: NUDIX hydrolase [Acidimicrobiales bacterium]|nr:NUDIX hydrolase [Acidimicrobiales bacterium]